MEWSDNAIVLACRAHGDGHAVVDLFTPEHGRWAGLVYGGQGRRMAPILQPGNLVTANWRGRLGDSLGTYTLELSHPLAAELMADRLSLAGLSAACAVAATCLPERQEHPRIYASMSVLLASFEDIDIWPALMARWELGLLADLGFGLTLDRCAATGESDDLIYVSPKSACAVSREAGHLYRNKMLPLPPFIKGEQGDITKDDVLDGLQTTGYFIETRILHLSNRALPGARVRVLELLSQME